VIGVGIDAVEVDRFRAVITRRPAVLDRLLTASEQAYGARHVDPVPRWAVRFAAKEAVMKAMGVGVGACRFRDIEVTRAESGAPSVALSGRAAELAAGRGITAWHLSLTHTDHMAVAVAVAL
jgi:holo-[acyl-carrier protein] synthase